MISLDKLGYNLYFEKIESDSIPVDFEVGRVLVEHKERYIVSTKNGETEAEITGHLRYTAQSREDFPSVGDWVALTEYDTGIAIIHKILPRYSVIKRKAVGTFGDVQIIASNIDYALIVQAVDRDFNINRIERYLTICNSSNVQPIIVLSKIDLIQNQELVEIVQGIQHRVKGIPIVEISNESHYGYEELSALIEKGRTYCMLGSSGVGKSTLLNNLIGQTMMKTGSISQSINRGRHVTSHRELFVLMNGGLIIDNPGMREVGIADTSNGLEMTFEKILLLAENCRYKDCTHREEAGCNVLKAVETGELDHTSYENYLKMEREKAHFESTTYEKRKKDKDFGKLLKNYKKDMRKNP